jgi:UDP-glucuronate decarboxylase
MKTSVIGTFNMLGLAKRTGAKILQASTSEIYGDPEVHPQHEGYWGNVNPIGVRSCYDEGKRAAETLCIDYHRQHNVRVKIVRIFNTYGPRMAADDGRVVSNFIVQALRNSNISIYGDGKQTRSFCYVDDLVDGLMQCMDTADSVTGPINLGNPNEIKIEDLADVIKNMVGTEISIEHQPLPLDDPKQRKPDISNAVDLLQWSPSTELSIGLKKTIDYFKSAI